MATLVEKIKAARSKVTDADFIDYIIVQNDSDGKGTYLIWHNTEITKPTDKKIADEKENAMNDYWWKLLRKIIDL